MSFALEICCYNFQSALIAAEAGADRIELCADAGEGGTTPGIGTIQQVRRSVDIELYPIIRPRGGDFLYTADEFAIMRTDIQLCKELGCDGVVIGMLNADGSIDKDRCAQLVELAYPMGVTFHRAFDRAANPFEALEDIISIGCERILSSGQKPVANDALPLLNELVRQANDRIIIMPGSGVRSANIRTIAEATGATEFHSSASMQLPSQMQFTNEQMQEKLDLQLASRDEILAMRSALNHFFSNRAV
ncbi:MAG: copper homeostasis protein CutC [Bacteroidota bacterium]|nr:copper homeostasis protein CutC [Bacteroidota bacterium]